MALIIEYEVLHPVRHGGYLHPRDSTLRLTPAEGSRLVRLGSVRVKDGGAVIEVADDILADHSAAFAALGNQTKAELVVFAKDTLGLTFSAKQTKEEIVAAILNTQVGVSGAAAVPVTPPTL